MLRKKNNFQLRVLSAPLSQPNIAPPATQQPLPLKSSSHTSRSTNSTFIPLFSLRPSRDCWSNLKNVVFVALQSQATSLISIQ
ncbi:hypothetical protein CEXT_775731 [Caerostris extrusa]|uniref:Uncharacterized protein n=1 Tax=Caerostris extrusa TaxID=172846 RepID=A0AAV4XX82_CAEEX|nr:hypothetical protein CEXT_775731 [Caerostris extrusa]